MIKAGYRIHPGTPKELFVPNFLTRFGGETLLKMAMQGDNTILAAGGNWYVGLTNEIAVSRDAVLSDLTGELTTAGGYARQAIVRQAADWTVDTVNGIPRCISKIVNFTATGADFSHGYTRAFLCDVASGTVGDLYSISSALAVANVVLDGVTVPIQYELYGEVD